MSGSEMDETGMRERAGASFEQADVVAFYPYRPPYADAVFDRLVAIAPRRRHLLDIGCGPGKIARPLAPHFDRVTAVDPSPHMIALGRTLKGGDAPNIDWVEGFAEEFPIGESRFDLTVAAASIHWMEHDRLFARLAAHAAPGHRVAIVSGDAPFEPAWETDWLDFLTRWVPALTGKPFDHAGKQEEWTRYREHMAIEGSDLVISAPLRQSIVDFIRCQHSRDTFAPSKMKGRMAEFDADLADLLAPHARDGHVDFVVRTTIVWGTIKAG